MTRISVTHVRNVFLSVVFILGLAFAQANALDDAIVAVINEDIITLKDLREYVRTIYLQLLAQGKTQDQIRSVMGSFEQDGLNRLIEDKLLLDQANKKGIQIRDKIITQKVDKIKKQYASELEFTDALASEGLTVTDLRNKISDQLKVKYLVEMEVEGKIFVNPQEVTRYYQTNIDQFKKPERVNLDSVFIAYGNDPSAARAKATEAWELLNKGRDFSEIAKAYSQSPSLGTIERGKLLPILEETIFNLKPGEASSPIEIDNGIYIFKVKAKIPAHTAKLIRVKADIYSHLFRDKFKERLQAWLNDLKKDAYIEIKQ